MSSPKTTLNDSSVREFLNQITDEKQRTDAFLFLRLFEKATQEKPAMWGDAIVGFGSYHYVYESGREGDWMLTGFSPRKGKFSLYIMSGFAKFESLMEKLGNHKTGKACLYVKEWEDVDSAVLEELISRSVAYMKEKYNG